MIIAPAVTYMLEIIIGNIPNKFCFGFQVFPRRKSFKPISLIAGIPFLNMNIHIDITAKTDTHAHIINNSLVPVSVSFFTYLISSHVLISPI